MKLTIEIDMDNAAFDPCPCEEAGRILKELADKLATHNPSLEALQNGMFEPIHKLSDVNGNGVGFYRITP